MKCSESCSFGGRRVWIIVGKALPMQIKELISDWTRGEEGEEREEGEEGEEEKGGDKSRGGILRNFPAH